MEVDHYTVLGITCMADETEIKRAYKLQARKWHPDRNKDNVLQANKKFHAVAAAYDVLMDTNKRKAYDNNRRNGGYTRPPAFYFPNTGPAPNTNPPASSTGPPLPKFFRAWPRNQKKPSEKADVQESSYTSTASPRNGYPPRSKPRYKQSSKSNNYDNSSTYNYSSSSTNSPANHSSTKNNSPTSIPQSVKRKLPVSLEDLYTGTTKRLKVKRQATTDTESEKIVEVVIKAGSYAGTEIILQNEGEITAEGTRQDIEFILEEKPHDLYTRQNDDLHVTLTLDLSDALIGFTKEISALDKTALTLKSDSVIQHGQKVRLNRRGMPNPETGRKGDLFVTYHILLPTSLSTSQKLKIMDALG